MDELVAADEPLVGQLDEHLDDVALHTEYRRLVEEQAAVRRLGTLVTRGAEPSEVIGAVAEEMRRCLGAFTAGLWRFETNGEIRLVAAAADPAALAKWPVGTRISIEGRHAASSAFRQGDASRPARCGLTHCGVRRFDSGHRGSQCPRVHGEVDRKCVGRL
jgi:hypothetical protein